MKRKKIFFLCFTLLLCVILNGCGSQNLNSTGQEGKLSVYTSFYPMQDFASKIGGDLVVVNSLVPAGVEPHDWEPSPTDIVALEQANLFVYCGAGMEQWVDAILPTLQNTALISVETAAEIQLLYDDHVEHDDDHDDGHNHGGVDPHVWLSPRNAKLQMEAIWQAMAAADPDNARTYQDNYLYWSQECDRLDNEYAQALANLENPTILVSHESFGYLCRDYGITQRGAQGLSPDGEPDPARMAGLVDFALENNVRVIFYEYDGSDKVAQALAREINGSVDVLDPLETMSAARQQAGEDYFSVMCQNLEALSGALQ